MVKEDLVFFIVTVIIVLFLCYRTRVDFKALTNSNVEVSTARSSSFWIKGFILMGLPLFFANSDNMSVFRIFFLVIMIFAGIWNFIHGFLYLAHKRKNKNI